MSWRSCISRYEPFRATSARHPGPPSLLCTFPVPTSPFSPFSGLLHSYAGASRECFSLCSSRRGLRRHQPRLCGHPVLTVRAPASHARRTADVGHYYHLRKALLYIDSISCSSRSWHSAGPPCAWIPTIHLRRAPPVVTITARCVDRPYLELLQCSSAESDPQVWRGLLALQCM